MIMQKLLKITNAILKRCALLHLLLICLCCLCFSYTTLPTCNSYGDDHINGNDSGDGSTTLSSDELVVDYKNDSSLFSGNVQIAWYNYTASMDKLSIKFAHKEKYTIHNIASAYGEGSIKLYMGDIIVMSRFAELKKEELHFTGDVRIIQGNTTITCDQLIYDIVTKQMHMSRTVIMN